MRPLPILGLSLLLPLLALGAVAIAGPPTPRTDVQHALERAREALQTRDWSAVVAALEGALRVARGEAPLVIRQAVLVKEPHVGLGVWRDDGPVVDGRRLRLYVEVENLVDAPLPDGRRRLSLDVRGRFALVDDDGSREGLGEKALGAQQVDTWRTTGVHSFGIDVTLSDKAPPGRYVVDLRVRDEVSGKTAERSVPFILQ